jgi:UDP-N-acetylglucosamine 2-epimerase (non-hydrolysing)
MSEKRIMCVVGTRPEAIKMAPVILALKQESWAQVHVLATAQHRQMLDQVLSFFEIAADSDLNVMRVNQPLAGLTARLLAGADEVLQRVQPDLVLVQGDTTTVMAVALAAFYRRIDIGHVEAGLRTGDVCNPFPEEANRAIAGRLARWHFAPTENSRQNLLRENLADEAITVTGNTVIDALLATAERDVDTGLDLPRDRRLILVTSHRRENFGEPIRRICSALKEIAERNRDVHIVYPVHPNPNVKAVAHEALSGLSNVQLCDPLDYAPFVSLMRHSHLIISDSGGVQEEAPALGKPVLVLREQTERPEAVNEGVVKLIGTQYQPIVDETQRLLDDSAAYDAMARGVSPYGDGQAAKRIVDVLRA